MWQTREAGHGGHCVGSGLRSGDKGGRCWVLAPADLPSRALPGEGGDHCVPKLPAGALLLKGDPSP